jgi:hypothetical protein
MTAADFANALVDRLTPILPAGFVARADGGTVYIDPAGGLGVATSVADLLDADGVEPEDYASAAWMVLSMAQDVVSETTAEPWPVPLGERSELAEPGTRVEGRQIVLYFGAEDQPLLTLPPIPL